MEPIRKTGISYRFYKINEQLEKAEDLLLFPDEHLMITNYYGIKDRKRVVVEWALTTLYAPRGEIRICSM